MLSVRVAPLRSVLPWCLGLLAGPVCLAKTAPPPPPAYCVTDLGSINEDTTYAYDLNNSAEVVGVSAVGTGITDHAFHWADGVMLDLGTPPPAISSSANRINEYGLIVGTGQDANGVDQAYYTFPYPGSTWRKIFHPGDSAQGWGVNDFGWMVGTYFVNSGSAAGAHPYAVNPRMGSLFDLGEISGSGLGEAFTINNVPQVGGTSTSFVGDCGVAGFNTPVIWQEVAFGQWTVSVLPTGGQCGGAVMAISENNVAVGFTEGLFPSPVVWRSGPEWSLELLEAGELGLGAAMDINESGQIVGFTNGAMLWTSSGQRYDLNTLIDAEGWDLASASAINDQGQIVGTGYHNGEIRAFLLTPKPPMTDCP
jgi:probable HAF family extracellular repeat protein